MKRSLIGERIETVNVEHEFWILSILDIIRHDEPPDVEMSSRMREILF